jgi:hypothetical protein
VTWWEKTLSDFAHRVGSSVDERIASRAARERERGELGGPGGPGENPNAPDPFELSDEWITREEIREKAASVELFAGSPFARGCT